jgi:hypothetical protein
VIYHALGDLSRWAKIETRRGISKKSHLSTMEPYRKIETLLNCMVKNQQYFDLYVEGINTHFRSIDEEERIDYFTSFIRSTIKHLHRYALNGFAEKFLDIPHLFYTLANMSNIRNCMYFKEDAEQIITTVKKSVVYDRGGEQAYVVEEEFMRGMFNAIRHVNEEHVEERKRRIYAIREELIVTLLSPKRLRLAAGASHEVVTCE